MVSVGGALEVEPLPADSAMPDLRARLGTTVTTPGRQRRLRLMRLGWLWCLGCQITTGGLPLPQRLVPAPWPAIPLGAVVVAIHQNPLKNQDV
jgi:hypothetical protein